MSEATFYINNTLVAKKIRGGINILCDKPCVEIVEPIENTETTFKLKMGKSDNSKESDDSKERKIRLSYIDMMIADAVYSLYKTEQSSFSPGKILRILSGDDKQTCRQEVAGKIRASLKNMARVEMKLDCSSEMKFRNIEDFYENGDDKYFKFIEKKELKKDAKYLNTRPYLYYYAEKIKQFVAVPWQLWSLEGKKPVRDSLENIALKHYLIHRILVANYNVNNKNLQNLNRIFYYHPSHHKSDKPYVGMLFDLDIVSWNDPEPDPEHEDKVCRNLDKFMDDEEGLRSELSKAKTSTHRNTLKILKAMKEIKFIDGYNLIKGNGKEIIGVEITGKANIKKYFGNTKNMQEKIAN